MKKYLPFILIFLFISLIPGLIFFLFPNGASNRGGDLPAGQSQTRRGLSEILEVQGNHYLIRLKPQHSPLRQGKQTLILEILNRDNGGPWQGQPEKDIKAEVKMPMESEMMDAPASITLLPQKAQFRIDTDFSMPGGWQLWLTLKNPDESIQVDFEVQ